MLQPHCFAANIYCAALVNIASSNFISLFMDVLHVLRRSKRLKSLIQYTIVCKNPTDNVELPYRENHIVKVHKILHNFVIRTTSQETV